MFVILLSMKLHPINLNVDLWHKYKLMINNKIIGIIIITLSSILFGQPNCDARMLGLNGSYTTLARGYQCIGVNPANLGTYNNRSVNLLNLSLGLSNNALSITNYNAINGANLEDTLSFTYYPKSQFYEMFGEYQDEWEKTNNSWLIVKRKLRVDHERGNRDKVLAPGN